jgi:hypothetical protein
MENLQAKLTKTEAFSGGGECPENSFVILRPAFFAGPKDLWNC